MSDARIKPKGAPAQRSGKEQLAQWIVRRRMSQAEAAEHIGISRVKLSQYLNAQARPSLETAIRVEDATGIAVRSWLVDDQIEREKPSEASDIVVPSSNVQ